MSKLHKAVTKAYVHAWDLNAVGLRAVDPDNGFPYRNSVHAWFNIVAFPALAAAIFTAASVVGFTVWPAALFIAAVFGLVSMTYAWATLIWFVNRGWGDAIVEMEHSRRKETDYPAPAREPLPPKQPRTRRRRKVRQ